MRSPGASIPVSASSAVAVSIRTESPVPRRRLAPPAVAEASIPQAGQEASLGKLFLQLRARIRRTRGHGDEGL